MATTVREEQDIAEYGKELWSYLTGRDAVITYTFEDVEVQVPRGTGAQSPRANWNINGTVRIATADRDNRR